MSVKAAHLESKVDLKPVREPSPPNVLQLHGTFHFCNGDEYTGLFALCREKQKIVRQGNGVYKTFNGQTYDGVWENDLINGKCKITFADKTIFTGNLSDMVIEGHGCYEFVENVQIDGDFSKNKLVGKAYLTDPNGKIWNGTVAKDGGSVTFRRSNLFWQTIVNMPSTDDFLIEDDTEENESNWEGF